MRGRTDAGAAPHHARWRSCASASSICWRPKPEGKGEATGAHSTLTSSDRPVPRANRDRGSRPRAKEFSRHVKPRRTAQREPCPSTMRPSTRSRCDERQPQYDRHFPHARTLPHQHREGSGSRKWPMNPPRPTSYPQVSGDGNRCVLICCGFATICKIRHPPRCTPDAAPVAVLS